MPSGITLAAEPRTVAFDQRMTEVAVRLLGAPPLLRHVEQVVSVRAEPQMSGVYAVAHVAGVAHQHPRWNRPYVQLVAQPMDEHLALPVLVPGVAVPVAMVGAGPDPAFTGLVHSLPEAPDERS